MSKSTNGKTADPLAPVRALNALALENVEKALEMQFALARRYTDSVLASTREALSLRDPDALSAYAARQPEVAKRAAEAFAADAKAIAELGQSYFEKANRIVADSLPKV